MSPKEILALLNSLERCPEQLNRRHLKKIYALLIMCGHYPVCPWCQKYIYNIKDFTWDHIIPQSLGGKDTLDNLQPMHKHCNNASKNDTAYTTEYDYDIKTELISTIFSVRIPNAKGQATEQRKHKDKYKRPRSKQTKHR